MSASVASAYFLYANLIITKNRLMPDLNNLANELWIIILIFIYSVLNKVELSGDAAEKRRKIYRGRLYKKYSSEYGHIIESLTSDKIMEALIYAVLIYESFNRPTVVRKVERLIVRMGRSKTLGPMQVETDQLISDLESVRIGAQKIIEDYLKFLESYDAEDESPLTERPEWQKSWARTEAIKSYNRDDSYVEEVSLLHQKILIDFYPAQWRELNK